MNLNAFVGQPKWHSYWAVAAEQLFNRETNQIGFATQQFELLGIFQKGEHAAADQACS